MKALPPLLALALLCLLLAACRQGGPAAPTVEPMAEPAATPDGAPMGTLTAVPTPTTPSAPDAPTPERGLLVPTPTPGILSYAINRAWLVSPSLEEQIFTSEVIVIASLLSATAGTETVPSDPGVASTYRAAQVLRFRVHEYLKGTGPKEAVVRVRSRHSYLTEGEARQTADAAVSERNTAWDDRRAVLFLHTAASGSPAFRFTLSNPYVQSEWDYAVDTRSRAWLPAGEAGGPRGQGGDSSSQEFITDGAQSPPPVVSVADLRAKIAENDTLLKAGEGIEGYVECLRGKIYLERLRRADPWTPTQREKTIAAGSAAGTEVYRGTRNERYPGYHNYWLSGPDMDLFRALIVDDDSDPKNGYDHTLVTIRPLSAGEYRVFYNWQHYEEKPCNHMPTDAYGDWTVTVTAPSGAVHEAFFDPADLTPGAGFSASLRGAQSRRVLHWRDRRVHHRPEMAERVCRPDPGPLRFPERPHAGLHRPGRVRGPVPPRLVGDRGQRGRHADVGCAGAAVAGRRPAHAPHSPGRRPGYRHADPDPYAYP